MTDSGGLTGSASITVIVDPAPPVLEEITITRAEFRSRNGRWRIEGTTTVPGPGNTLTAVLDRTSETIGSADADGAGGWRIRPGDPNVVAPAGDSITVTSTGGASATATVNVRR